MGHDDAGLSSTRVQEARLISVNTKLYVNAFGLESPLMKKGFPTHGPRE